MLSDILLVGYVLARVSGRRAAERFLKDERGEGVISAAIAVLIMAFLGAAMWIIFRQILDDSGSKTDSTINNIGGDG
ncbi:MAG: hypothetical protein ABIV94_01530 [Acidimicrobiales bacterium]